MNGLGNVIRGPVIMTPLITDNYRCYRPRGVISTGPSPASRRAKEEKRRNERKTTAVRGHGPTAARIDQRAKKMLEKRIGYAVAIAGRLMTIIGQRSAGVIRHRRLVQSARFIVHRRVEKLTFQLDTAVREGLYDRGMGFPSYSWARSSLR